MLTPDALILLPRRELDARGLLTHYWPPYAAFINGPQPRAGAARNEWVLHRRALDGVLLGRRPLRGQCVAVPLYLINVDAGPGQWAISMPRRRPVLRLTLMLLGRPEAKGLLRRCDRCDNFLLAARALNRARSFCSRTCQAALQRQRRNKKAQATYMRSYRKLQAARRKT